MTAPTPHDLELLQRHLDDRLSAAERRALEARLPREPELAAELERARAWNDHLAGVLRSALAPPDDLEARVRAWCAAPAADARPTPGAAAAGPRSAESAPAAPSATLPARPPIGRVLPFRRDSLLAAAAGVLLAVSLGLGLGDGPGGPASDLRAAWLDGAYEAYATPPPDTGPAGPIDCNLLEDPVAAAPPGSWSPLHLAGPLSSDPRTSDPRTSGAPVPTIPVGGGGGGAAGGAPVSADDELAGLGMCGGVAPHPSGDEVRHLFDFPADLRLADGWSVEAAGRSPELPDALFLVVRTPTDPCLVVARPTGAPAPRLRDRAELRLARRSLGEWTLYALAPPGAPDCLERFVERP